MSQPTLVKGDVGVNIGVETNENYIEVHCSFYR